MNIVFFVFGVFFAGSLLLRFLNGELKKDFDKYSHYTTLYLQQFSEYDQQKFGFLPTVTQSKLITEYALKKYANQKNLMVIYIIFCLVLIFFSIGTLSNTDMFYLVLTVNIVSFELALMTFMKVMQPFDLRTNTRKLDLGLAIGELILATTLVILAFLV